MTDLMDDGEFAELLEYQSDVVWRMDLEPEVRFVYISSAAEEVLGYPAQAFIDDVELWFRMVHRRDLHLLGLAAEGGDSASLPTPEHESVTVRFFRRDGSQRWAGVRWRRVEKEGRVSLFGVTRDVTYRIDELRRARRVEERLAEAETLAKVGSYDWDLTTDSVWFSTNLYRLLGQDPENWTPSYEAFEAMLAPGEIEPTRATIARAAELGVGFVDDFQVVRPDGAVRRLDVIGLVEMDDEGQLARLHGVMRDVTEEREAEAAQLLFIADAAHELRTPVATLVGAVGLLHRRYGDLSQAERDQTFELVVRQSQRLSELSTSLLDLAALDYKIDPVALIDLDVAQALEDAIEVAPPPEGLEVRLIPTDLAVSADPWRFERVLVNLLVNAYRYAVTEVTVEARAENGAVTVSIADDGPGVPATAVERLFSPFHRAAGEQGAGSGLGLAIVRRLVETMDGSVSYRDVPGGGACFVVRLRAA